MRTPKDRTAAPRAASFTASVLLVLASVVVLAGCGRDCSTGYVDEGTGRYVTPEECEDDTNDGWLILLVVGGAIAWTIHATRNGGD